jgi:hypothetical protein
MPTRAAISKQEADEFPAVVEGESERLARLINLQNAR